MAIIPVPASLKINAMEWTLHRPAQINRSEYTGRRQVVANPWHARWSGNIEIAAVKENDARGIRAFLLALKGQINTFRLSVVPETQSSDTVTAGVDATAGAVSLSMNGWTNVAIGHFFSVNDELHVVTSIAGSTIGFQPPLRNAVASGSSVKVDRPTLLVALAEAEVSWGINLGPVHTFGFSVEEAF
jgi:hypothetical protein